MAIFAAPAAIGLAGKLLPFLVKAGSAAKLPLVLRTAGVVGGVNLQYCPKKLCRAEDWISNIIPVAVDPKDSYLSGVNTIDELKNKVDWIQTSSSNNWFPTAAQLEEKIKSLNNKKGVALLISLWILIILSLIVGSIAIEMNIEGLLLSI